MVDTSVDLFRTENHYKRSNGASYAIYSTLSHFRLPSLFVRDFFQSGGWGCGVIYLFLFIVASECHIASACSFKFMIDWLVLNVQLSSRLWLCVLYNDATNPVICEGWHFDNVDNTFTTASFHEELKLGPIKLV